MSVFVQVFGCRDAETSGAADSEGRRPKSRQGRKSRDVGNDGAAGAMGI